MDPSPREQRPGVTGTATAPPPAPRNGGAPEAAPPAPAPKRTPTSEEIVNHPLVKKAVELFGDRKK